MSSVGDETRRTSNLAFAIPQHNFTVSLSPIDLIPDFIPGLGYLDDLLLIPLGPALVVKLTPTEVLETALAQAKEAAKYLPAKS